MTEPGRRCVAVVRGALTRAGHGRLIYGRQRSKRYLAMRASEFVPRNSGCVARDKAGFSVALFDLHRVSGAPDDACMLVY